MSVNKVQAAIESAENSCKARGANLTSKRKQVLSALLQSNKARSAYELVDYCKDKFGEALPPMSVYRILDFLQDEHPPRPNTADEPASLFRGDRCLEAPLLSYYKIQ